MSLPHLSAEASAYQTRTPATAGDRTDGLEAVRDYINRIDLTALKQQLTLPPARGGHSWTAERADAAEAKYKKWLFLRRKYEDVLQSPGSEVDTVWHFHILDSRAYIRDTARIFGHYLPHYPYFGITEGMTKAIAVFETTRRLFRAEYGEDL